MGWSARAGAGKSTLVWLLLRFYDPQSGRVTLGGHDVRDLSLDTLRRQFSVVTQDTYIFQGTVADNLRLGKPDATPAEMEEAARAANAHEYISELPDGYDTWIGERGIRLSGGERQRLAIARALLKAAPILLLDEALSSVDSENEAAIQEALERLMVGKTTLIIAHRLSSVVSADRILVLDRGRLVETGSHAELAATGGAYSMLMSSQQSAPAADLLAATLPSGQTEAPARGGLLRTPAADIAPEDSGPGHVSSVQIWRRLFALVRRWRAELALSLTLGLLYHASTIALGATSALLVVAVFRGGDFVPYLLALGGAGAPERAHALGRVVGVARPGVQAVGGDADRHVRGVGAARARVPGAAQVRRSRQHRGRRRRDDRVLFRSRDYARGRCLPCAGPVVLGILAFVSWPLSIVLAPFLVVAALSPFYAQRAAERLGYEMRTRLGDLTAFVVDGNPGHAGDRGLRGRRRQGQGDRPARPELLRAPRPLPGLTGVARGCSSRL